MKAAIYVYDKYTDRNFSYILENVVYVGKILDTININYIKDGRPVMLSCKENEVKIIIEN